MKKILKFIFPNKANSDRILLLDTIRGITVINMIIYHALYDAVYLCSCRIAWFEGKIGGIWEFLICSVFIILSGFCMNLSNHPYKRGLTVFGAGLIVTAVTFIFIPEESIVFGILTFLGCAMLFTAFTRPLLDKIQPFILLIISVFLFIFTIGINNGYLGLFDFRLIALPEKIYNGLFMTFLGFTDSSFNSSDYFSFIPWIFLFISGYSLGIITHIKSLSENNETKSKFFSLKIPLITFFGQRALLIYLIHQPLLYLIVLIVNCK